MPNTDDQINRKVTIPLGIILMYAAFASIQYINPLWIAIPTFIILTVASAICFIASIPDLD